MKSISDIYDIIQSADNILIGAGAGLSTAAGLLYTDQDFFDKHFPGYRQRYGLTFTYGAAFHEFPTLEEHYLYWARHIKNMRYDFPVGGVYHRLREMVRDKNYFIITTNADGQFEKAGFPREKLFTPQGDYSYFQCSVPCGDELYPNRDWVDRMLKGLSEGDFAGGTENIPHCPRCGELLTPNLRKDGSFVEAPWMAKQKDYIDFINSTGEETLLLWELGVGFNTPAIIRFPFERLTTIRKNTTLIRVNPGDTQLAIQDAAPHTLTVKLGMGEYFDGMQ